MFYFSKNKIKDIYHKVEEIAQKEAEHERRLDVLENLIQSGLRISK